MRYMLMIFEDERIYGPDKKSPAMEEIVAKHMAFGEEIAAVKTGGAGLQATSSATTVRAPRGNGPRTVHDGPFAETKEQLGGYYLIDVPDLDAAIAVAKKLPLFDGGSVEIRPLLCSECNSGGA